MDLFGVIEKTALVFIAWLTMFFAWPAFFYQMGESYPVYERLSWTQVLDINPTTPPSGEPTKGPLKVEPAPADKPRRPLQLKSSIDREASRRLLFKRVLYLALAGAASIHLILFGYRRHGPLGALIALCVGPYTAVMLADE